MSGNWLEFCARSARFSFSSGQDSDSSLFVRLSKLTEVVKVVFVAEDVLNGSKPVYQLLEFLAILARKVLFAAMLTALHIKSVCFFEMKFGQSFHVSSPPLAVGASPACP